ncbi:MAG: hypothetical protein ABIP49_08470 [Lysobacterales bacterium]
MFARLLFAVLVLANGTAHAAVCTWNVASGNWNVVANWSGCSDVAGPSTRTPNATDTALIGSGAVSFNVDATVAGFEIGSGASLSLVGGAPLTLTVNNSLRLNGGTLSTSSNASFPFLRVILGATGTGQVLAPSALTNTVELENRGLFQVTSASGTALSVRNFSRVVNVSGSTFALGGGNARLNLEGSVPLTVQAGATLSTNGNVFIGKSVAGSGAPRVESFGSIAHVGPGALTIQGSGSGGDAAVLQAEGLLSVTNGTLLCNGVVDNCRHQNGSSGSGNLDIVLANGTYSRGGPTGNLTIPLGSKLLGSGTLDGTLQTLRGLVSAGAESGLPYGNLSVTGGMELSLTGELRFDIGGKTAGMFDTLAFGGSTRFAATGTTALRLQLAPGFEPPLDTVFPLVTYASVLVQTDEPIFSLVDSNYALDFAARFTPTVLEVFPAPRITVDDANLIEGNAGDTTMSFNVRLSQPSTQTVTARLSDFDGTAVEGPSPGGDYVAVSNQLVTFAPGETLRTAVATIHGESVVEADEAFRLEMLRVDVVNAALGNGVRGNPNAAGTIVSDDLPPGTRFVLVGKDSASGNIRRYTHTGSFIDVWNTMQPNSFGLPNTGQCFAPNGDVLATRFAHTSPIRFSRHGAVRNADFGSTQAFSFNRHESCVFDQSGNVYVGQAGFNDQQTDAQVPVLKFNSSGVLLDSFVLPTGPRGTDWIDLAADQCMLFYTSEDTTVRRYNLCTRSPLPPLITTLTAPSCYALRQRPNREVMVACQEAVHRVSPQGVNVQTYTRQSIGETNAQGLFALNLDPDGTSFWTAGGLSGNVYRVDIASGAVLTTFNSGPGGVAGLAVYDELFGMESDVLFANSFEAAPPPQQPAPALILPAAMDCNTGPVQAGFAMPHYSTLQWIAEFQSAPVCAH